MLTDFKGNTQEEVYELFYQWCDNLCEVVHPFDELPRLNYSDLVAFCGWNDDGECYGDLMFDLWHKKIYKGGKIS